MKHDIFNFKSFFFFLGGLTILLWSYNAFFGHSSTDNDINKNIQTVEQKKNVTTQKRGINTKLISSKKPNIIIFLADDLGWNDVGYHGSEIKTPNIDKLANEGIQLERFYVNFSCTPTRAGLMTARQPGRMGLSGNVILPNRRDGLAPTEETIAEVLTKVGYQHRICLGKWHLGHSNIKYHPLNQGFTYFYGHYGGMIDYFNHTRKKELDWHRNFETCYDEGYSTFLIGNEAVKFIEDVSVEEPFFLYTSFNAPHTPLQAVEKYLNEYGYDMSKGIFMDSTGKAHQDVLRSYEIGQGNSKRQTYAAMVMAMDATIGRILRTLDKRNMTDNTIVLFISDNGGHTEWGASNEPLHGQKGTYYEGGVRVPAIIKYPNVLSGKRKINKIVSYIDVIPTLLGLGNFNVTFDNKIDGLNLSNLLRGEQPKNERTLYLGRVGLATQTWKLVYKELYNIVNDPNETKNLSQSNPKIVQKLTYSLDSLRKIYEIDKKPDYTFKVQKEWKMPK